MVQYTIWIAGNYQKRDTTLSDSLFSCLPPFPFFFSVFIPLPPLSLFSSSTLTDKYSYDLVVTHYNVARVDCSNKGKVRRGTGDGGPEDDGDYATLRELPLITSLDPADDSTSEENKVFDHFPSRIVLSLLDFIRDKR